MRRRTLIQASGLLATQVFAPMPFTALANSSDTYSVALITDPVFLKHHISSDHPESPARIDQFQGLLKHSALASQVLHSSPLPDYGSWLESVHTSEHIKSISTKLPAAHLVAGSAVSSALRAVDLVSSKKVTRAFCATRPPGHHALNTGKEEGFCYYNQVAIAARYAQQHHGFKKVLIIDWDYHHGNSTEAVFYTDPDVLFFSSHDQFAYPGTGAPDKRGSGQGKGLNINVHLPCGSGDEEILTVYAEQLVPVAEQFQPDIIMISAGFDSRIDDLLGCFKITDRGFSQLTEIVMKLADKHCEGRLVSILEGGYNLTGNASAMLTHLERLNMDLAG